jgi:catechol 2,3-dioxygenase-like lactoylglutathione lyase family enzyme
MKGMLVGLLLGISLSCFYFHSLETDSIERDSAEPAELQLGNFSVSLTVKDIQASIDFYQKLGFKQVGGNPKQRWIVLQNETATIGLFQGMFDKNTLTFNPGWDRNSKTLDKFDDVREIQKELISRGVEIATKADESTDGPAFLAINDPDGNPILIDQHVSRNKK